MLQLLRKRRSIRKYTDKKVEKEKILNLIQGALLSPSSKGSNPWEFIVVDNTSLLEKLSLSKPGAAFLKNAQLGIVVLGNPDKSDVWIEDAAIASTILHLLSESLGLGSCWIQIRERKYNEEITAEDYVRQVLNIPENIRVLSIVSIGYPNEVKQPYDEDKLSYEKIYSNSYNNNYIIK